MANVEIENKNPRMSDKKIRKERETVDLMIAIFCKKKHRHPKNDVCVECKELMDYCHYRLSLCPWGEKKPFCSNCLIHCYDKEHRERIRQVMRFSGPRMIFSHPILALSHVIETKKEKKKLAKKGRNANGNDRNR